MNKIEQEYNNLTKSKGDFDMGFKKSAYELGDKLRQMGIERPKTVPRISDPAHSRGLGNSHSTSLVHEISRIRNS